jgi:hypothetical protein
MILIKPKHAESRNRKKTTVRISVQTHKDYGVYVCFYESGYFKDYPVEEKGKSTERERPETDY